MRNLVGYGEAIPSRPTTCQRMIACRHTVRSWNSLLTCASLPRSLTANSGRIYSKITSVGMSSKPTETCSSDAVDIVACF